MFEASIHRIYEAYCYNVEKNYQLDQAGIIRGVPENGDTRDIGYNWHMVPMSKIDRILKQDFPGDEYDGFRTHVHVLLLEFLYLKIKLDKKHIEAILTMEYNFPWSAFTFSTLVRGMVLHWLTDISEKLKINIGNIEVASALLVKESIFDFMCSLNQQGINERPRYTGKYTDEWRCYYEEASSKIRRSKRIIEHHIKYTLFERHKNYAHPFIQLKYWQTRDKLRQNCKGAKALVPRQYNRLREFLRMIEAHPERNMHRTSMYSLSISTAISWNSTIYQKFIPDIWWNIMEYYMGPINFRNDCYWGDQHAEEYLTLLRFMFLEQLACYVKNGSKFMLKRHAHKDRARSLMAALSEVVYEQDFNEILSAQVGFLGEINPRARGGLRHESQITTGFNDDGEYASLIRRWARNLGCYR